MSLLAKQVEVFRQKHGISEKPLHSKRPPPSVLYKPDDAKRLDPETVSAVALHGISEMSKIEPDVAEHARLFEGPPRDRDMLVAHEDAKLNERLRRLLLLISPHMMKQAAQEILEGLLHRFTVHVRNVDDVLVAVIAYHDSVLFTRLVQGVYVEGNPRWSWLKTVKNNPATLLRSSIAKYAEKDLSLLEKLGEFLEESCRLHKDNQPVATFFAALWVDTLTIVQEVPARLADKALPPVRELLRKPHLKHSFHAALTVAGALCTSADLGLAVKNQLLERSARQLNTDACSGAAAFLVLFLQLQTMDSLPPKVVTSLLAAGPDRLMQTLPDHLDSSRLLRLVVEACVMRAAEKGSKLPDSQDQEQLGDFIETLLKNDGLMTRYGEAFAQGMLKAFCMTNAQPSTDGAVEALVGFLKEPLASIGARQPLALSTATKDAVSMMLQTGAPAEALSQLLMSSSATVKEGDAIVPLIEGFTSKSADTRLQALREAVKELQETNAKGKSSQKSQLLVSLVLQTAQDKDVAVAAEVFDSEGFWFSASPALAATTLPALESMLANLITTGLRQLSNSATSAQGKSLSLQDDLSTLLLQDERVSVLLPRMLGCMTLAHVRKDCSEEMLEQMETFLLPLLIAVMRMLDSITESQADDSSAAEAEPLTKALLEFCNSSRHPLLGGFDGKAGHSAPKGGFLRCLVEAADFTWVPKLCRVAEGKAMASCDRHDKLLAGLPLGGLVAQAASAQLLAEVLHRLLSQGAATETAAAEQAVVSGALACRELAQRSEIVHFESACINRLANVVLASATTLCQQLKATADTINSGSASSVVGRKKRRSAGGQGAGSSGGSVQALQRAVLQIMQVAFQRPRDLANVLQSGVRPNALALSRPAMLRLALLEGGEAPPASVRNALLCLRSLIASAASKSTVEWQPHPAMVVPLMVRLAVVAPPDVRGAYLSLSEALYAADWDSLAASGTGWEQPLAVALLDAGVFSAPHKACSEQAWASCSCTGVGLLSASSVAAFLEHVQSQSVELQQDSAATAVALSSFLTNKKHGTVQSARLSDCACWLTGLTMCSSGQQGVAAAAPGGLHIPSELLEAIPLDGAVNCLQDGLGEAVQEVVRSVESGGTPVTVPKVLITLAARVSAAVRRGRLAPDLSKKAASAQEASLATFASTVAKPLCDALAAAEPESAALAAESVAELMHWTCEAAAYSVACFPEAEWALPIASSLLHLYANAASPADAEVTEEGAEESVVKEQVLAAVADQTLAPRQRIAASAHAAFVATPLTGNMVQQLLSSEAVQGTEARPSMGKCAMDAIYQHLALFKGGMQEVTDLLQGLSGFIAKARENLLHSTLRAIAALCEHAAALAEPGSDNKALVSTVCAALAKCGKKLGAKLTAAQLSALIRACTALAPLSELHSADDELPTPLNTLVKLLGAHQAALKSSTLTFLRGCLRRLWRFPLAADSQSAAGQDAAAQSRLRGLLSTLLLSNEVLVDSPDAEMCFSLSRAVGVKPSLDFLILVFLTRRAIDLQASAGKSARKRRKKQQDEIAEALEEILPEDPAEEVIDQAFQNILMATEAEYRFHCVGSLAQTLARLALSLDGQAAGWNSGLLPATFMAVMNSKKVASRVLDVGVSVLYRFISEHGMPVDMDLAAISTGTYRRTVGEDVIEDSNDRNEFAVAALSVCHLARSISTIEACLLRTAAASDGSEVSQTLQNTKQLRSLLLRSMAVNHPLTFFRTVGLALHVAGYFPPEEASQPQVGSSQKVILSAAGEALQDRVEKREESGEEVAIEAEAILEVCSEVLKHVCVATLKETADSRDTAELQTVAWRFIDGVCRCTGKSSPEPVIKMCLPAMAKQMSAVRSLPSKSTESESANVALATAASLCLRTIAMHLGRAGLSGLNTIMHPLLNLVALCCSAPATAAKHPPRQDLVLLEYSAVRALQAMYEAVGAFMTPFLDKTLEIACAPSPEDRTLLLEGLAKKLLGGVPLRQVVPALYSRMASEASSFQSLSAPTSMLELDTQMVRTQRLLSMLMLSLSEVDPEIVQGSADVGVQHLLRTFSASVVGTGLCFLQLGGKPEEIPSRLLRRNLTSVVRVQGKSDVITGGAMWQERCSEGDLSCILELGASAFMHLAMRLADVTELRPRFVKVLDWARGAQSHVLARQGSKKSDGQQGPEEVMADTEDAFKALALCSIMQRLIEEAGSVLAEELILPLVTKDIKSSLVAARRNAKRVAAMHMATARKRKRASAKANGSATWSGRHVEVLSGYTWWWFEVCLSTLNFITASLKEAGQSSSQSKAVEEAVEELLEVSVACLDICEYLPSYEEAVFTQVFVDRLQAAVVAMVATCDEARTRRYMTTVLAKRHAEDPEVRLASVKICHKLWSELGVQVVTSLSEVLMHAVELIEDEDPRVEKAVRAMIKTMEFHTGENLQEHLKR